MLCVTGPRYESCETLSREDGGHIAKSPWSYCATTNHFTRVRNHFFCLFVCLGLTSLWNIWGHITTVPACSSGTLTNVLPHRNAMPQTQDTTPHPVTVYRHGANLSLCYPSMWNVTLEYTATHFNVLGETRPGNPSPTFHTHQRTFNLMLSWWSTVGSSVESTVPTGSWTRDLWCANPVRYRLAHSDFLTFFVPSYSRQTLDYNAIMVAYSKKPSLNTVASEFDTCMCYV